MPTRLSWYCNSCPLRPTSWMPSVSSSLPGASATMRTFFLPLPDGSMNGDLHVLWSLHSPHFASPTPRGLLSTGRDVGENRKLGTLFLRLFLGFFLFDFFTLLRFAVR